MVGENSFCKTSCLNCKLADFFIDSLAFNSPYQCLSQNPVVKHTRSDSHIFVYISCRCSLRGFIYVQKYTSGICLKLKRHLYAIKLALKGLTQFNHCGCVQIISIPKKWRASFIRRDHSFIHQCVGNSKSYMDGPHVVLFIFMPIALIHA